MLMNRYPNLWWYINFWVIWSKIAMFLLLSATVVILLDKSLILNAILLFAIRVVLEGRCPSLM